MSTTSTTCTWTELRDLIEEKAGAADDDVTPFDGDSLDTPFEDLGYDSLAILETASALERRYGVSLPDEEVGEVDTPQDFLDLINGQLA